MLLTNTALYRVSPTSQLPSEKFGVPVQGCLPAKYTAAFPTQMLQDLTFLYPSSGTKHQCPCLLGSLFCGKERKRDTGNAPHIYHMTPTHTRLRLQVWFSESFTWKLFMSTSVQRNCKWGGFAMNFEMPSSSVWDNTEQNSLCGPNY